MVYNNTKLKIQNAKFKNATQILKLPNSQGVTLSEVFLEFSVKNLKYINLRQFKSFRLPACASLRRLADLSFDF